MLANLDPVLLARIQFAFTTTFHIVFPAFTIGLASWLAVIEWRYLKTGSDELYRPGNQLVALAGALSSQYLAGSSGSRIPIALAGGNRYHAAGDTHLYGLLLLHL